MRPGTIIQPPFANQQVVPVPTPVGTVIAYAGPVETEEHQKALAAQGWLYCNGREVPQTDFRDLYDVIRDSCGPAKTPGHFRLPDYRGAFLRGVNDKRSEPRALDPDAGARYGWPKGANAGDRVGSYQDDHLQDHKHFLLAGTFQAGEQPGARINPTTPPTKPSTEGVIYPASPQELPPGAGKETRPVNVSVNFLIKAVSHAIVISSTPFRLIG